MRIDSSIMDAELSKIKAIIDNSVKKPVYALFVDNIIWHNYVFPNKELPETIKELMIRSTKYSHRFEIKTLWIVENKVI